MTLQYQIILAAMTDGCDFIFPEPISKFCSITKFFFAIHLLYLFFNFSDEIKRFWDILDVIGYF